MNNKYDFSSKKYIILLGIICLLFAIVVVKAFDYLPQEKIINSSNSVTSVNSQHYNTPGFSQDDVLSEQKEETKKKQFNISLPKKFDNIEIEEVDMPKMVEIDAPPTELGRPVQVQQSNLNEEDGLESSLKIARDYKKSAKYVEALDEYKNVLSYTSDKNTIAQVYQEIAEIYAASRRYGTALSYATKSYNMSPTSYRELLLARLYYKTGDIDKATARVNNILRRDFAEDR